jgi:hypothetical protein
MPGSGSARLRHFSSSPALLMRLAAITCSALSLGVGAVSMKDPRFVYAFLFFCFSVSAFLRIYPICEWCSDWHIVSLRFCMFFCFTLILVDIHRNGS